MLGASHWAAAHDPGSPPGPGRAQRSDSSRAGETPLRSVPHKPLLLALTSARELLPKEEAVLQSRLLSPPVCPSSVQDAPLHLLPAMPLPIRAISHGIWIELSAQEVGESSRDVSQPGRQAADGLRFQGASRSLPLTSQFFGIS